MPKRSLETLSEPMFYVLMALRRRTLCGVEIVHWIGETTEGRITLGPGTLYTILSKLTDEQMIREVSVEGRKRTYELTDAGKKLYDAECDRSAPLHPRRGQRGGKRMIKLLPYYLYQIDAIESWLDDQAKKGLFLTDVCSRLTMGFEKGEPRPGALPHRCEAESRHLW